MEGLKTLDPDGHIIAEHIFPHSLNIPQPGWAEQDADDYLLAFGTLRRPRAHLRRGERIATVAKPSLRGEDGWNAGDKTNGKALRRYDT